MLRKEWLYNPFRRIAGAEALLAGFGIMLLTACVAWPAHMHFDGVLDAHSDHTPVPAWVYFVEPFIDWGCSALSFLVCAVIGASSRFRAIDVCGTLALCRAPMIFAAIAGFAIPPDAGPGNLGPVAMAASVPMIVAGIWMVVLMYHAVRVSVNPKPGRLIPIFICGLVLAEVLSKPAVNALYSTLSR